MVAKSPKGKKLNVPGCMKDECVHAAGLSRAGKEIPCHFHRWMNPKRLKVIPFLESCGKRGLARVSHLCLCPETGSAQLKPLLKDIEENHLWW